MTFSDLGVPKNLVKGLSEMGIKKPTAIQEKAIPILLHQKTDFIGKAQTGTGKTAAFGIPILSKINPGKNQIQALILTPTRELGQQIAKQLFRFTKYTDKIFTESAYGGEKIDKQLQRLRRPTHIIVATPGRLIDLMERKAVDISKIHTVVLDEADEMLSMGFKKELTHILSKTEGHRNIWLFSATFSSSLDAIINTYISRSALRIEIDKNDSINKKINHQFVVIDEQQKLDTLSYFLKTQKTSRGIIFTKTKVAARSLYQQLINKRYEVGLLEGDMTQKDRDKVMRSFKKNKLPLLVSTDVSARGIDVANLAFVVHYQLPDQSEYYVHRSGRTARAGKEGLSLAFVAKQELALLKTFERELGIHFLQIR